MLTHSEDDRKVVPHPEVGTKTPPSDVNRWSDCEPRVDGKFLALKGQRFYVRGASYGSFAPSAAGVPFPNPDQVRQDFDLMTRIGINTVRLHDLPPAWLLDMAQDAGLYLIIGIPWAQHLCLDQTDRREVINTMHASSVAYGRHPATLMFCVGNEIPSPIVRWYGKQKTERFIRDMCAAVRDASPQALVTYANYPTTEYLELPFLDVAAFNVYLHDREQFQRYLAHLHLIAGDRPLLLSELGLDSLQHSESDQAEFFRTQIRDAFNLGLCGTVAFSWTDEWFRGGKQIDDWAFGLVDARRKPKAAYYAMGEVLRTTPFDPQHAWPRISVVVAAYNAASTLHECLTSLVKLAYPNYEVIVVDDGSHDETGTIADTFAAVYEYIDVIHTKNGGLSTARNVGMAAGNGDIVAYTDADCRVDPNWLHYLALTLMEKPVAAAGGPNLVPSDDGFLAQCVGKAPGNPLHILLDDEIAEHIPGCNMAFWRYSLESVGGFNPDFHVAGDDVDLCWRLQAKGYQIGFSPAALVWHHRRNSISAYLKQQVGYGQSEAILEEHHPSKFNHFGQVRWFGSIYGISSMSPIANYRIFYGKFGSAPFQAIERTAPGWWFYLPQMPEWYLFIAILATLSPAFPWLGIVMLAALALSVVTAVCAGEAAAKAGSFSPEQRLKAHALIVLLYLLQPLARTWGRFKGGLGPLRVSTRSSFRHRPKGVSWRHFRAILWPLGAIRASFWSENGLDREAFLLRVMDDLYQRRLNLSTGTGWEPWDLHVLANTGERAYIESTIEYHGGGRCMLHVRNRPHASRRMLIAGLIFLLLAIRQIAASVSGVQTIDQTYDLSGTITLYLPLAWLVWLFLMRIHLNAVIFAALERVAQEMKLIPLKK